MKRFALGALVIGLLIAISVPALAVSVICDGWMCLGSSVEHAYEYRLTGQGITSFEIGWGCDLCLYNVYMPAGWQVGPGDDPNASYRCTSFVLHGLVASPDRYCHAVMRWWGPAVDNPVIGYCSPHGPQTVGWSASDGSLTDWSDPVGELQGAVHAPCVPEPASLIALGSGLVTLAGAMMRRRR